jgi:hypothetical protein
MTGSPSRPGNEPGDRAGGVHPPMGDQAEECSAAPGTMGQSRFELRTRGIRTGRRHQRERPGNVGRGKRGPGVEPVAGGRVVRTRVPGAARSTLTAP